MNSTHSDLDSHAFERAETNAARSPCPALNSLSAHGYLPRSGRDISFLQLFNAIREVYNTSILLTAVLTLAGFFLSGHNGKPTIPFWGTIDLHDLAIHNRIEHDASLAHADAAPGTNFAPTTPDKALLDELVNEADGRDTLLLDEIARVRSRREVALKHQGKGLNFLHAELARGEAALLLGVIGDGEKISTQDLREWVGEERLPNGWKRPEKEHGLVDTAMMMRRIQAAVNKEKQT